MFIHICLREAVFIFPLAVIISYLWWTFHDRELCCEVTVAINFNIVPSTRLRCTTISWGMRVAPPKIWLVSCLALCHLTQFHVNHWLSFFPVHINFIYILTCFLNEDSRHVAYPFDHGDDIGDFSVSLFHDVFGLKNYNGSPHLQVKHPSMPMPGSEPVISGMWGNASDHYSTAGQLYVYIRTYACSMYEYNLYGQEIETLAYLKFRLSSLKTGTNISIFQRCNFIQERVLCKVPVTSIFRNSPANSFYCSSKVLSSTSFKTHPITLWLIYFAYNLQPLYAWVYISNYFSQFLLCCDLFLLDRKSYWICWVSIVNRVLNQHCTVDWHKVWYSLLKKEACGSENWSFSFYLTWQCQTSNSRKPVILSFSFLSI